MLVRGHRGAGAGTPTESEKERAALDALATFNTSGRRWHQVLDQRDDAGKV